jgi:hypothetical protein
LQNKSFEIPNQLLTRTGHIKPKQIYWTSVTLSNAQPHSNQKTNRTKNMLLKDYSTTRCIVKKEHNSILIPMLEFLNLTKQPSRRVSNQ